MIQCEQWLLEHLGRLPDGTFDHDFDGRQFGIRDDFIRKFGFAILSQPAIDALRPHQPWIEVGAGSGYWAYELSRAGVVVVPTDPGDGKYSPTWKTDPYTTVLPMDGVETVTRIWGQGHNLLMVWPTYEANWPVQTLEAFTGQYVAYVGEGYGGCTANDAFHERLERDFEEVQTVRLHQFTGIHDQLQLWKRNSETQKGQK